MAGMVAFGRRWSVATDDFMFAGIIDFIVFLFWFCWASTVYNYFLNSTCTCENFANQCIVLHVFLIGVLLLFLLTTILSLMLIICGARGAISQTEKRQSVVFLVYVKSVLMFLEFVWSILGSVLLAYSFSCADFNAKLHVEILTALLWVAFLIRIMGIWWIYDGRGKEKRSGLKRLIHNENFPNPVTAKSAKKWKKRLWTMCFGFVSRDRKMAIGAASELLAYLTDDLDIVFSDFITGVKLYRDYSLNLYKTEKTTVEASPILSKNDGSEVDSFPTSDMPSWMNLKLASHYFKVGSGVFGWPWVIYRNLTCGICYLCRKMVCCLPCRSRFSNIEGDNCCGCNLAGLRQSSGYNYEDLVHVRFVDKVYQIPFFVAVDDDTSSVVLVVRGSMSMDDALTDMSAQFSPLDEPNLPKDGVCHGGALMAARRIRERLQQNKALEKAFSDGRENYSLVITGHSIGGGVSSLLSLLLKDSYENIRCFAFAPPPVMNTVLLPLTFDSVFSVIYGNDVIPFLNYKNTRTTLVDICKLLDHCKEPKYKVLLSFICCKKTEKVRVDSNESGPENEGTTNTTNAQDADGVESNTNGPLPNTTFLLPGRILHIRLTSNGFRLQMNEAENYSRIVFRPDMMKHHFPQFMEGALNHLGRNDKISIDDEFLKETPHFK